MRIGQHLHPARGAVAHDGVFAAFEGRLHRTQVVGFGFAGQVADEEVFGLRQQVAVDRGGRLGAVDDANIELGALFGKARIHVNHGPGIGRKNHVRFFKVNLHIAPVQLVADKFALLLAEDGQANALGEGADDLLVGAAQIDDHGFGGAQAIDDVGGEVGGRRAVKLQASAQQIGTFAQTGAQEFAHDLLVFIEDEITIAVQARVVRVLLHEACNRAHFISHGGEVERGRWRRQFGVGQVSRFAQVL